MKINQKQIDAIIKLPGLKRYEHFVKTVVSWGAVWALDDNGWALAATNDGIQVLPLWPAKEYAQLCATNEWAKYSPLSFDLEYFRRTLLPKLELDGVLPGVFFTPDSFGVTPSVKELQSALHAELSRY